MPSPPDDPRSWPFTTIPATTLGLPGHGLRCFDLVGPLPPRPRLAIVGSRAAHQRILAVLPPLLAVASARGWSLVSGGALGIDGGAHRAALELGVAQLAVLPCGRDQPYPPGHARLFASMAADERAALLFAQPLGVVPARAMFASRNAIVVGLADAVLVAQAGLRSGSIGTGRLALGRHIPLAAVAGSPGCGVLIGAGARALPVPLPGNTPSSGASLVAALDRWLAQIADPGDAGPADLSGPVWPEPLAWLATAIHEAGPRGLTIDTLPNPGAAALAMIEAELLGLVCEAAPGRWVEACGSGLER